MKMNFKWKVVNYGIFPTLALNLALDEYDIFNSSRIFAFGVTVLFEDTCQFTKLYRHKVTLGVSSFPIPLASAHSYTLQPERDSKPEWPILEMIVWEKYFDSENQKQTMCRPYEWLRQ